MRGEVINIPVDKETGNRKGFGFIKLGDNTTVFFHRSGLVDIDFPSLRLNTQVEFDVVPGRDGKGPRAENIRLA